MVLDQMMDKEGEKEDYKVDKEVTKEVINEVIQDLDEGTDLLGQMILVKCKGGNGGACGFEDGVDGGGPCYECGG